QFVRDGAFVLDREVGNAAPRIEPIGRGEGLGGAGFLAGIARSAAILVRCIGRKRQRGVERAEEQPVAMFAADKISMFTLPTDAGHLAERLFHHRRGIDEDLEFGARRLLDKPARQGLERLLEDRKSTRLNSSHVKISY